MRAGEVNGSLPETGLSLVTVLSLNGGLPMTPYSVSLWRPRHRIPSQCVSLYRSLPLAWRHPVSLGGCLFIRAGVEGAVW